MNSSEHEATRERRIQTMTLPVYKRSVKPQKFSNPLEHNSRHIREWLFLDMRENINASKPSGNINIFIKENQFSLIHHKRSMTYRVGNFFKVNFE